MPTVTMGLTGRRWHPQGPTVKTVAGQGGVGTGCKIKAVGARGWLCWSDSSRVGEQAAADGAGRGAFPSRVRSLTRPADRRWDLWDGAEVLGAGAGRACGWTRRLGLVGAL